MIRTNKLASLLGIVFCLSGCEWFGNGDTFNPVPKDYCRWVNEWSEADYHFHSWMRNIKIPDTITFMDTLNKQPSLMVYKNTFPDTSRGGVNASNTCTLSQILEIDFLGNDYQYTFTPSINKRYAGEGLLSCQSSGCYHFNFVNSHVFSPKGSDFEVPLSEDTLFNASRGDTIFRIENVDVHAFPGHRDEYTDEILLYFSPRYGIVQFKRENENREMRVYRRTTL